MIDNLNITKCGKVQNKITGNWLKGEINNSGYKRVYVFKKRFFIHRLVAERYIPNPENLPQVNHIDGDKLNNSVENLEWVSESGNQQHRYYVLKKDLGSKNANSKLNEEDIKTIRKCNENGESGRSLSRRYKVSQTLIRNILSRKAWKHI